MSVANESRDDTNSFTIGAVVIAVVLVIALAVYIYNKEKIGKAATLRRSRPH